MAPVMHELKTFKSPGKDRHAPLLPHVGSLGEMLVLDLEPQAFEKHLTQNIDEAKVSQKVYSLENGCLLASYFSAGFAVELLYTPVTYYLIDTLGASSSLYIIYTALIAMASSFKVFYGILSDCVPIRGLHRKPYVVIGWLTHTICYALLALMDMPSANTVIVMSFLAAAGHLMGDIMTDAIVIGRTRYETDSRRGHLQASGYIYGAFGKVCGALGGTFLSQKDNWGWGLEISTFFWIAAATPLLLVLPLVPFLAEAPSAGLLPREAFRRNCQEIWLLVQNRAVYLPMMFIFMYKLFNWSNAAWNNFLLDGLGYDTLQLGLITVFSSTAYWIGLNVYKRYMRNVNWQLLWVSVACAGFMISVAAAALALGWNSAIGIPDEVYTIALGIFTNGATSCILLPACVMYALMSPKGSEGTSYAMLTSMGTAASSLATAISDLLTDVWDVSDSTLEEGDFSGVWKLTLLVAFVGLIPLVLVPLLPRSKEEQQDQQLVGKLSRPAGILFLCVAVGSVAFSLSEYSWKMATA